MPTKRETYADKLDAIIERAPALRAAGVLKVDGDVSFTLAPPDPPERRIREEEAEIDSLDDFRKRIEARP